MMLILSLLGVVFGYAIGAKLTAVTKTATRWAGYISVGLVVLFFSAVLTRAAFPTIVSNPFFSGFLPGMVVGAIFGAGLSYSLKVRKEILLAGVYAGDMKFAQAVGRGIKHVQGDWRSLLGRLRKQGLTAIVAAPVAAAWLRDNAQPDRLDFPLHAALDDAHNDLMIKLDRVAGPRVRATILRIMDAEGIKYAI